jgi:predicted metal-dependent hydrolase
VFFLLRYFRLGNINFNYKIALLPPRLADYIVVHELCHLGEFNHSKAFWDLVAVAIPDYRERRAELRAIEKAMQLRRVEQNIQAKVSDRASAIPPTLMGILRAVKIGL